MWRLVLLSLVAANASAGVRTDLSEFIGLQHFQPCYFVDEQLPCLLDGAMQINKRIGSRIFKFLLSDGMEAMYPLNNVGEYAWPNVSTMTSLAEIASLPQVEALFSNSLGTNFTTFVLWAYRPGPQGDAYWCDSMTSSDAEMEIAQFSQLTQYIMSKYANTGLNFTLEHWEGDWAARCGSYNSNIPPSPQVISNMISWLQSRQTGVQLGRAAFCKTSGHLFGMTDCSNDHLIMTQANVFVYHGCEVNLVVASINNTFPNLINSVVPFVALDTVSYSSYDSQSSPLLSNALDYIYHQMNRSASSPDQPIFITEWGLGLEVVSLEEAQTTANNVISIAFSKPYVSKVLNWQIINNELKNGTKCGEIATFDAEIQNGFWAVQPNMQLSYFGSFLQGLINNSIPIPLL